MPFRSTASVEFLSFIVVLAFDGRRNAFQCGSSLVEADAGLGLHLGFGVGQCFDPDPDFVYLEFTFGAGIGGGLGFNICGAGRLYSA